MALAPPPTTFGRYDVICKLGEGGMASVYLVHARDNHARNKLLVVKELRPEIARDEAMVAMFVNEAQLAARLNHKNVVQLFEAGESDGRRFLVMEYLDGAPFNELVMRIPADAMTLGLKLHVLCEVLNGLHHAHELTDHDGHLLDVVHRDVSPQNVFVTCDGVVKLVDFGIAKARNSSSKTESGVFKGKVQYAAPEQVLGVEADRRVDVFAVGVMLWEAVAGQRLWSEVPQLAIFTRLAQGEIRRIRDVAPSTPEKLAAIVDKALAPIREDRYDTARAMRVDLEDFAREAGLHASGAELGEIVTAHFHAERSEIRKIVDDHMRGATGVPTVGRRSSRPDAKTVALREAPPPSGTGRGVELGTDSGSVADARPGTKRRWRPVAAVGAILVASLAVGGRFTTTRDAPAAASSSSPVSTEAPRQVTVQIDVEPAQAKVELDGRALEGATPFRLTVPSDSVVHALAISAPGYVPLRKTLTFDADANVTVSLEKEPAVATASAKDGGAAPRVTPPRSASRNGAAATPAASHAQKPPDDPLAPLDESNPYGHP